MKTKNIKLTATDSMDVFVVWTNTDLTEGRGGEYPLAICKAEATAKRLGRGRYVQGTDCRYTKEKIYFIDGAWLMRGCVVYPEREDLAVEAELEIERVKAAKKAAAIEKAKKLGLSEEEIEALK